MVVQLRIAAGTERPFLSLADAMRRANGEVHDDSDDGDGAPLAIRRVASRTVSGFRYQRCGGGKRIIRKQAGRNG